jgi:hypothetical protein
MARRWEDDDEGELDSLAMAVHVRGDEFGRRMDGDGRAAWSPQDWERKWSEKLEEARCGEGAAQQRQLEAAMASSKGTGRKERRGEAKL